MRFDTHCLAEPDLEFGDGGRHLDPRYGHEEATAVGYAKRLAYDIPLTVIASKE